MPNPTYALMASLIWAFSPIYYKTFMQRFDFLLLNSLRTSLSAAVLFLPALYYGFDGGVYYALLSGGVSLAAGDTLFLLSIREMGASIAAPVVYTYVLFVQLTATIVGEAVPFFFRRASNSPPMVSNAQCDELKVGPYCLILACSASALCCL